ncbi:DEAD/DEAH box helicase family protein [Rufibacter sediminis]|nr:DEAD/DEAH box helicase [Rufibacter sediminis]
MQLRGYQESAVSSIIPWLRENPGQNGLVVMATGTGKSYVMAEFMRRTLEKWPDTRIICATHVADLVDSNYKELKNIWPKAPAGVYSAGLKSRDTNAPIIFAGIQSIYNRAYDFQKCNILLVDEAHTISREGKSRWGQFIKDMLVINPRMRIIGFTATEFRLDSGNLIGGEDALFHGVIYEYGLLEAVQDGYLCEIIPKSMATKIDMSAVGKTKGEYKQGEMDRAVDQEAITKAAIKELMEYGHDRKTWMLFCTSVKHCQHVCEEIRSYGISCEVVTGETSQAERERIYAALKNGSLRSVCSVAVMTTGTNIPNIDLIGGLRPTASAGLLVQMAGRGTRLSPGKKNCLYLDWAGNIANHGPLDKIRGRDRSKPGDGIPPMKECPNCSAIVFAGIRICPDCSHEFPPPEPKINAIADNVAMLSTQKILEEITVEDVQYHIHEKKGKKPCLRVEYYDSGYNGYREWIHFEILGNPRIRAANWWRLRTDLQLPNKTADAFELVKHLKVPGKITVDVGPKYPEIVAYDFSGCQQEEVLLDWDNLSE